MKIKEETKRQADIAFASLKLQFAGLSERQMWFILIVVAIIAIFLIILLTLLYIG